MYSGIRLVLDTLRVMIPVVTLLGSAPTYFLLWFVLRVITWLLYPREVFRRGDDYFYSLYQRAVLFFFENPFNAQIYFHGDYEEIIKDKENVLYLSNHQSSVDWIVANMLAVRQGSLGHIRYVLKSALKWIPLYGFYFQEHGCIFVRRNDRKDLERVERGIRQVKSNGLPVWLVIFPEGTRYNPINNQSAIERSNDFAREKGVRAFEHVLYPRSGATVAAINALRDELHAVYDITVMYGGTYDHDRQMRLPAPSMAEYLRGQTRELHVHIRRIPIAMIPKGRNDQISHWLLERFVLKDKLLKQFYQSSGHDAPFREAHSSRPPVQSALGLNETLYAHLFFLLANLFLLITSRGRLLYWTICLFGTPMCFLWMHFFPPKE